LPALSPSPPHAATDISIAAARALAESRADRMNGTILWFDQNVRPRLPQR
jgi:hypothetical protein